MKREEAPLLPLPAAPKEEEGVLTKELFDPKRRGEKADTVEGDEGEPTIM